MLPAELLLSNGERAYFVVSGKIYSTNIIHFSVIVEKT